MAQQLTPAAPLRFVDLFCGAGLASRGLVQAGMEPMGGIDHWPVAVESYRANFEHAWQLALGPDDQYRSEVSRFCELGARPDLVWVSPPSTALIYANRGAARQAAAIEAVWWGGRTAALLAPTYVVLEGHASLVAQPVLGLLCDVFAREYGAPQVSCLDAHLFAGSPATRLRAYVIWTRRGCRPPALLDQPERAPMTAEAVIDWRLPLTPGHEGLCEPARAAIERHFKRWRGVPGVHRSPWEKAAAPITGAFPELIAGRRYLLVTQEGRRQVTLPEARQVMGVPDCHVLRGSQKARFRQLGNGTDVRMSEAIGRAIVMAHAGIEAGQN